MPSVFQGLSLNLLEGKVQAILVHSHMFRKYSPHTNQQIPCLGWGFEKIILIYPNAISEGLVADTISIFPVSYTHLTLPTN